MSRFRRILGRRMGAAELIDAAELANAVMRAEPGKYVGSVLVGAVNAGACRSMGFEPTKQEEHAVALLAAQLAQIDFDRLKGEALAAAAPTGVMQ